MVDMRDAKESAELIGAPVGHQITVFLVDDHEVVRRGVAALLEDEEDIRVVGEAGTAEQARARIPTVRPDVVVLDVRLPDESGATVCRDVQSGWPGIRCLMLTSFADEEALYDAIMAGAAGYVLKQIHGADLVGAVRMVAAGGSLFDPGSVDRALHQLGRGSEEPDTLAELTVKERRILDLIGEGLTNREIGDRLYLAEKTVKNYVSGLLSKLDVKHRTQAAILVTELRGKSR